MEEKMTNYFAYGSNMNLEQMAFRCPQSKKLGPAVLNDYKVVERLYADIDEAKGEHTDGLLWKVNDEDFKSLDKYEGYPTHYIRFTVQVIYEGKPVDAIVYKMADGILPEREGKPYTEAYRLRCRKGAEDNGIPSVF